MKLLDATEFFRGLFLTSPSATNYAADSCPALKLHHFNVTQPCSSSGSWSDLCTADPRAPCNSSRALHGGHTLFSLRIWRSRLLQGHFQTTMEQLHPAEWRQPCAMCRGTPDRVLRMQPVASQTKHPAHLTKECEGNLRNTKLLCFSSKSELCRTSLTETSRKIFSGLTEKHAKIWQDTSSFIMVTVGLPPFWSYVLPVALGTTNKPPEANLGSRDFFTEAL